MVILQERKFSFVSLENYSKAIENSSLVIQTELKRD